MEVFLHIVLHLHSHLTAHKYGKIIFNRKHFAAAKVA